MENREILIELRNKLEDQRNDHYMCWILKDMGIECDFLKASGIEAMWIEMGHNTELSAYQLNENHPAYFTNYSNGLREEKIKCINLLLERDYK